MKAGRKYTFSCMNAMLDGVVVTGIKSDEEAIDIGRDYEATVYRINDDGSRTVIYSPAEEVLDLSEGGD